MPQRISIALATFNGSKYLQPQLESLASQTRLPDELVVSDDCSEDETARIVTEFSRTAPFPVRFLSSTEREGLIRNFNRAMNACSGEIILLCDQDDIWLPRKIEVFERALDGNTACFSNAQLVDRKLRPLGVTLWEKERFTARERRLARSGRLLEVLAHHNVVQGASLGFHRSLLSLVTPLPDVLDRRVWVHDGWIAICAALVGEVRLVEESLILYRIHGENAVGNAELPKVVEKTPGWYLEKFCNVVTGRLPAPAISECSVNHVYEHWQAVLDVLADRVSSSRELIWLAWAAQDKARHADQRALTIHDPAVRRLARVVAELIRGRYHRWSEGLIGAVRDLVQGRP